MNKLSFYLIELRKETPSNKKSGSSYVRGIQSKFATSYGNGCMTRIVRAQEAVPVPQPPQAILFATSLRRSSFFPFDPEGQRSSATSCAQEQGAGARSILSKKVYIFLSFNKEEVNDYVCLFFDEIIQFGNLGLHLKNAHSF